MNTKMILEIAGAKPLATTSCGAKPAVLNLLTEKGGRGVPKNLEISPYGRTGKKSFRDCEGAYGSGKEAAVGGLGVGMWRGVFG